MLGGGPSATYNITMPTVPCFHVDAFTSRRFAGNPAAVCLLAKAHPAKWMQAIAAELNLSETAFVVPMARGLQLRWFTPKCEVDLCGHATLATAHVLWQEGLVPADQAIPFHTRSGQLVAARLPDGRIELDFPARPAVVGKAPKGLAKVLGAKPVRVAHSTEDLLVELESAAAVRALQPDLVALGELPVRGVVVTAASDQRRFDFVSRFFAPAVGVPEDPVTGSAHCVLAPWWSERLGRAVLKGYQASARGGEVEVEVAGDRVLLRGAAVTVVRGELQD